LANSPTQRYRLFQDNKRYSKDFSSGWITWDDRESFPPGSSDPAFLFFRPFNALGKFYQEDKMLSWVEENHLNRSSVSTCLPSELGQRDECIREIVSEVAIDNTVVIVPVGISFLPLANNLRCSLQRVGIENIVHWALDKEAHLLLIERDYISFYNPEIQEGIPEKDAMLRKVFRAKPKVLLKILSAGYNIWYLDADTVVNRDFRSKSPHYRDAPFQADIVLSVGESISIKPTEKVVTPPMTNSAVMYIQNSQRSRKFFADLQDRLNLNPSMDDTTSLNMAVADKRQVLWTGIGDRARTIVYPDEWEPKKEEKAKDPGPKVPRSKGLIGAFENFLSYSSPGDDQPVRLHFFDPLEFVSGHIYFQNPTLIPEGYSGFYVIHADGEKTPIRSFKDNNIWYLDSKGYCKEKQALPPKGRDR
jgi:hypothetical protein